MIWSKNKKSDKKETEGYNQGQDTSLICSPLHQGSANFNTSLSCPVQYDKEWYRALNHDECFLSLFTALLLLHCV